MTYSRMRSTSTARAEAAGGTAWLAGMRVIAYQLAMTLSTIRGW
jgi:hypothetical protein